MNFIFLFFIIILFIGLFILVSVIGFIRSIFGFGRRKNNINTNESGQSFEKSRESKSKVFPKNKGEYVEYEEIKD